MQYSQDMSGMHSAVRRLCFFIFLIGVTLAHDNEHVAELMERFFQWRLEDAPEYAIKTGIPGYADKVQSYTEEAFQKRKDGAELFLQKANTLLESHISKGDRQSLVIMKYMTETLISGFPFRKHSIYNPVSPLDNVLLEWRHLVSVTEFNDLDDYTDLLTRYNKLPVLVEEIITLMNQSIQSGITQSRYSVVGLVDMLSKEIEVNTTDSHFYSPFKQMPDTFSDETKENLTRLAQDVVHHEVIHHSWERLHTFLIQEYMPNTRPDIGVWSLPNGTAFYQQNLLFHLSVPLTAEQVHSTGLREVARIRALMQKIMEEADFKGDLTEYLQYVRTAPDLQITTKDELIGYCTNVTEHAKQRLTTVLKHAPDDDVIVVANPNQHSSSGWYSTPPLNSSRPGMFIINTHVPRTKIGLKSLTLHETIPGHHTQSSYERTLDLPMFRRVIELRNDVGIPFNWPFFTAYSEGWALYGEYLGHEMGIYMDKYDTFGQYASEIYRAVRLVVDTGIHAFRWNREEAVEYMRNNTALAEAIIQNEVNRYISLPGQACAYKIGELKLKELRQRATKRLGKYFCVYSFHAKVLSVGSVPLTVLEQEVEEWIEERLKKKQPKPKPVPASGASHSAAGQILKLILLCQLYQFLAAMIRG